MLARGVPAEHHEVGPGRRARQHPARVRLNHLRASVHLRMLVPPGIQQGSEPAFLPGCLTGCLTAGQD
jgi:hypothetical protein